MGIRSPYPATPQAKQRCRSKKAATLPDGADGEFKGCSATTPAATIPYIAAVKEWTAASDRPRDPNLAVGGGALEYSPSPWAPHPTDPISRAGGWCGQIPAPGSPCSGGRVGGDGCLGVVVGGELVKN